MTIKEICNLKNSKRISRWVPCCFLYNVLRSDVIKRWQYFYTRSFSLGRRKSSSFLLWAFNNEFLWLLNIYLVLSCPWSHPNEVPLECLMKGYLSKYILFIIFSIHKNELQAIFFFHIKFIYSIKKISTPSRKDLWL